MVHIAVLVLFILWSIPTLFIASLARLNTLQVFFPFLSFTSNLNRLWLGLLEGSKTIPPPPSAAVPNNCANHPTPSTNVRDPLGAVSAGFLPGLVLLLSMLASQPVIFALVRWSGAQLQLSPVVADAHAKQQCAVVL
jgi:hypothetical protein